VKKLITISKIVFIASLVVWVVLKFDVRTARDIVRSARLEWGILALLLAAMANIFVAMRWGMLIRGVWPGKKVPLKNLYWFNFLAVFYSIFVPTSIAGEAVRIYKLKNAVQGDYPLSTIVVTLDRMLGAGTWFVLFMVFPTPFRGNRQWLWLLMLVPAALFIFRRKIALGEHRFIDFTRHHPRNILAAVINSLAAQFLFITINYCIFKCFALSVSAVDCAGLTATTTLAAIVPISLMGIGFREGSLLAFLPHYGASPTQAMMVTSFMVFLTYVFGLCGGIVELASAGWSFSRLRRETDELQRTMQSTKEIV